MMTCKLWQILMLKPFLRVSLCRSVENLNRFHNQQMIHSVCKPQGEIQYLHFVQMFLLSPSCLGYLEPHQQFLYSRQAKAYMQANRNYH